MRLQPNSTPMPLPMRRIGMIARAVSIVPLLCTFVIGLRAQSSYSLIADINPARTIESSDPSLVTRIGSRLVFHAKTRDYGDEWWTVPVAGGEPSLLRDIQPGTQGSRVYGPALLLRDVLYFVTEDSTYGRELWRTDGTPQGTAIALDLVTGPLGSSPDELVIAAGNLWFRANGRLYVSGGTMGTTREVFAFTSSTSVSGIRELNATEVVFKYEQGANLQLWKSDGTAAGSGPILDPLTNLPYRYDYGLLQNPSGLVVFESGLGPAAGVYATDGTSAGTRLLIPGAGLVYQSVALIGNRVVFLCRISNQFHLCSTDGTTAGTSVVYNGVTTPPIASGGLAWFVWSKPSFQFDLMVTDGTSAGTRRVATLSPNYSVNDWRAVPWEGGLLFSVSAGSSTDIYRVTKNFALSRLPSSAEYSGAAPVLATEDQVYWVARSPTVGVELFELDATQTGLRLKANAAAERGLGSSPDNVYAGDRLWFSADDGTGRELWVSDGTTAGTKKVVDLSSSGTTISSVGELFGRFIFSARVANSNNLMVTDGTSQGSQVIASGEGLSGLRFNNKLWFPFITTLEGHELACSDGTPAGTRVFDLVPGTGSSQPAGMKLWRNELLLRASHADGRRELFRCDGTTVHQVTDTTVVTNVFSFDIHRGQILLMASSASSAGTADLWGSDGTKQGTSMILDLPARTGNERSQQVVSTQGLCFFSYYSASQVFTLGVTDGTAIGTSMISDPSLTSIALIGAIEDRVFYLTGPPSSLTLHVSDGTPANTRALGLVASSTTFVSNVGSRHTWTSFASTPNGYELWRTSWRLFDRELVEVSAGPTSSHPRVGGIFRGRLFFTATRLDVGDELFAVDVATTRATSLERGEGCGDGVRPTLHATDAVLGQALRFRGDSGRPAALGATFVGPLLRPSIGIDGGCRVVCDVTRGILLRALVTDNAGAWNTMKASLTTRV